MLCGESLELCHELASCTRGELGVKAQLHRLQALLLERATPLRDAALGGHVAKRIAAVEREGFAQQRPRPRWFGSGLLDELVESPHVDLEAPRLERVPGRPRARAGRRADRGASTGARAAPRPRSAAGARPTARRSAGRGRAARHRRAAAAPAAIAGVRSAAARTAHPARAPAGRAPRNDRSRRPPQHRLTPRQSSDKTGPLAVLWCGFGAVAQAPSRQFNLPRGGTGTWGS